MRRYHQSFHPQCVCEQPTKIIQSTHPTTAAQAYYTCGNILPEMRCNFFQWIDGPEMYDRALIQQKYMLNYAMRTETFQRWKPYVPDPIEKAPEEPRIAGWWWRTPKQEAEYDRAHRATDKWKAPAT